MAKLPNAFGDVREAAELLASGRLPKQVSYLKKIPMTSKVRALITKASSENPNAAPSAAATVLRGATKYAVAATAKKIANAINGKFAKGLSSISRLMALASLGAVITEEMDPRKLRRPLFGKTEGSIVNASQAAKSLIETNMSAMLNSLISGVPLAVGLPPKFKIFKTLLALKKSPRFFSATIPPVTPSPGDPYYEPIGGPDAVIIAQRGLLEDEIAHRLTLIAENVIVPIRQRAADQNYGPLVILEGFRAENSGLSPHERGEAVDMTVGDGTLTQAESLYNLAIWARDAIIYDQLILCYSNLGGGQAWLHVTFTPEGRRRQVFTKPFNDVHVDGLHWYGLYTDNAIQAQDKATLTENLQVASSVSAILAARDARLNPVGVNTPEQSSSAASVGGLSPGVDPQGHVYQPNNEWMSIITGIVAAMLTESAWRLTLGSSDFIREVIRRAYVTGVPSTGERSIMLNGVDGSTNPSATAIAISNYSGAKGFSSWKPSRRVQIVEIVGNATGTAPVALWNDITVTPAWTLGGGLVPLEGTPDVPAATGPAPSDSEVLAAVQNAAAASPGFLDYVFPIGGFDTYSTTEIQMAFGVTLAAAQDLATRYPGVGIMEYDGASGTTYSGFPGRYSPDGLFGSFSGPEYDTLARRVVPGGVHLVPTAQNNGFDGLAEINWRSPTDGQPG